MARVAVEQRIRAALDDPGELVGELERVERVKSFAVPEEDGARVAWQVTAHLPDGGRGESESFFSVIGPAESP